MHVGEDALPVGRVAHLYHVADVQQAHDVGLFSVFVFFNAILNIHTIIK